MKDWAFFRGMPYDAPKSCNSTDDKCHFLLFDYGCSGKGTGTQRWRSSSALGALCWTDAVCSCSCPVASQTGGTHAVSAPAALAVNAADERDRIFFTGLSLIPLTDAAALMSTNPVLITLGAAIFLGEPLGVRRVAGIAVALVGAMIIIRPGSDVFSLSALLPLAAAACYSGYALLTRRVGADEDVWTSLFYTGLVGTVLLSLAVPFQWQSPDMAGFALMIVIALAGTIGQLALIRAFSQGEAAMLAPYSYSGLAFAAYWGFVFFAEIPDFWTVFGSCVIAGAGLYVWHRETYKKAKTISGD